MAKLHSSAAPVTFALVIAIASAATWTEFKSTKCYNGHGGASQDPNDPRQVPVRGQSVQQCQEQCIEETWCAGIVVGIEEQCWLQAAVNVQYCETGLEAADYTTYTNGRDPFEWIADLEKSGGKKTLGAGTYYIDRQYVLPTGSSLIGAGQGQTIIQAVRWLSSDGDSLCGADAKHRIGIIVGNDTYVGKFTYTGVDKERPFDNMELCAGDAIEFPGCTESYCESHQYTGNGNGDGANNVVIEDIVFTNRTVQNMVFVPQTDKGKHVSSNVHIRGLSTLGTWADGLNIHGAHQNFTVENCEAYNTGDDCFAAWDSSLAGVDKDQFLYNITFLNNKASNPHFDGNNRDCYSQFGGRLTSFIGNQCNDPTHAMIHYWIQFCGTGHVGSPGDGSICYPTDSLSVVEGNTLTGAGAGVKPIEKDDSQDLPKTVDRSGRSVQAILHV